jgi:predicted membrane protein
MRNQRQILIGTAIIVIGLVFLIGAFFGVDAGVLCVPTALILLGIGLLLRPWLVSSDTASHFAFLGPVRRRGAWQLRDEEIWLLVGDVNLDATEAEIPVGETRIRVLSFVGAIRLTVPEAVGVAVSPTSLVIDANMLGRKRDVVLAQADLTSDDYQDAARKIRLEPGSFVADVKVKRG